jgi:hypothetical protein
MSNRAYLSVWCNDFSEATMLDRFGAMLATVPFSATRPGFERLIVRAVDATESPLFEHDLRAVPLNAEGVVEMAREGLHDDSAFEALAYWDLWTYHADRSKWISEPQPLEIFCYGPAYDNGVGQEFGHLHGDLGFEDFFTGHLGLLGLHLAAPKPPEVRPEDAAEAAFLAEIAKPGKRSEYQDKTQQNIRTLMEWVRRIGSNLPVENMNLGSEGEENFEARMDEILAAR